MSEQAPDPRLAETALLVQRAQQGDSGALQALFTRYYESMRPIVRARLGPSLRSKVDSGDILDTAFGDALHALGRFDLRTEGAFLHWLSAIVARTIRDKADFYGARKRGGGVREIRGSAAAKLAAELPDPGPSPSEDASRREAEARLYSAMDLLDEGMREVLFLSRFQHLSHREIGEILDCSADAARMRIVRAERALVEAYLKLERTEP